MTGPSSLRRHRGRGSGRGGSLVTGHSSLITASESVVIYSFNSMLPHIQYLLRLGDNALILAQRLSEWCGHAPVLEEDLALANVALDLIGQARLVLAHAGRV